MINILFISTLFPILVIAIIYFLMPNLIPKNLQFGVRIPPEYYNAKIIGTLIKFYRLAVLIITILIIIGLYFTYSLEGIYLVFLEILLYFINYYIFRRVLINTKVKNHWYTNQNEVLVAEIEEKPQKIKYNMFIWSIPSIVMVLIAIIILIYVYPSLPAIIPTHFNDNGVANGWENKSPFNVSTIILLMAGMTILFYLLAVVILKTHKEIDPSNPELSSKQEQKFKIIMSKMIVVLGWFTNLTFLFMNLQIWEIWKPSSGSILVLIGPVFAGVIIVVIASVYTGAHGSRLKFNIPQNQSNIVMRDDDKYWIAGAIYFNREDKSLLVQKRYGIGWTINMGNFFAWFIILIIILIVLVPVLFVISK
jgi:uncharacterized membrane protein